MNAKLYKSFEQQGILVEVERRLNLQGSSALQVVLERWCCWA